MDYWHFADALQSVSAEQVHVPLSHLSPAFAVLHSSSVVHLEQKPIDVSQPLKELDAQSASAAHITHVLDEPHFVNTDPV